MRCEYHPRSGGHVTRTSYSTTQALSCALFHAWTVLAIASPPRPPHLISALVHSPSATSHSPAARLMYSWQICPLVPCTPPLALVARRRLVRMPEPVSVHCRPTLHHRMSTRWPTAQPFFAPQCRHHEIVSCSHQLRAQLHHCCFVPCARRFVCTAAPLAFCHIKAPFVRLSRSGAVLVQKPDVRQTEWASPISPTRPARSMTTSTRSSCAPALNSRLLSFFRWGAVPASLRALPEGRETDGSTRLGSTGSIGPAHRTGSAMTKSYQKRRPSAPCRDCQKRRALKRSILPRSNRTLVRRSERADATARHETPRSWLGCTVRVAASVAWLNWLVAVADLCARAWLAYASCVVTQRGLLFGE
jgi:hypothetical protein